MNIHLAIVIRSLWKIYEGFLTLGRLYAIKSLAAASLQDKNSIYLHMHRNIEFALRIVQFMQRTYARKEPLVSWPSNFITTINNIFIDDRKIDVTLTNEIIRQLTSSLSLELNQLYARIDNIKALIPVATFLAQFMIFSVSEENISNLFDLLGERISLNEGIIRITTGPKQITIGKELSFSKHLAADICTLSMIEYDGLPFDFYVDMTKQAFDKLRHADIYNEIIKILSDDIKAAYTHSQTELEKNLYETMWNMTIEERFILMHSEIETSIHPLCEANLIKEYSHITNQLDVIKREEVTHTKATDRWLKYLLPNPVDRVNAIKHAGLLRGIFILTSTAQQRKTPLPVLIDNLLKPHICLN